MGEQNVYDIKVCGHKNDNVRCDKEKRKSIDASHKRSLSYREAVFQLSYA